MGRRMISATVQSRTEGLAGQTFRVFFPCGTPMQIAFAELPDAPAGMDLLTTCMENLLARGIHQWDHIYPDISFVEADARAVALHLIRENDIGIGSVF